MTSDDCIILGERVVLRRTASSTAMLAFQGVFTVLYRLLGLGSRGRVFGSKVDKLTVVWPSMRLRSDGDVRLPHLGMRGN